MPSRWLCKFDLSLCLLYKLYVGNKTEDTRVLTTSIVKKNRG